MTGAQNTNRFDERLRALSADHQRGILRFHRRLLDFERGGLLTTDQREIVDEHLLRLGERGRNPANTGNIEDLFCYTLTDTKDAIRAFAQALADSVKVVPMDEGAALMPRLFDVKSRRRLDTVGACAHLNAGDKMLVTHTMVAYGDPEMRQAALRFIHVTRPTLDAGAGERELARMAVQSQHHPSSTFVLARAHGLSIEVSELYAAAGYDDAIIEHSQRFYDVCADYRPDWATTFLAGHIPVGEEWADWRRRYMRERQHLPGELVYQLASDTLTNFLQGTLESGKWTDASVMFGGVTDARDIPAAIARIVNQYIAEHIALHDGPAVDLTLACAGTLRPWGIGFENDRAVVLTERPEKTEALRAQFEAAWARKNLR